MTVIAGVSLFSGVMLSADCRVSILRPGLRTVVRDEAQKVFGLTPTTIIGFSGDVATASALMYELLQQIRRGKRTDAVSIHQWLPRFFKTFFAALKQKGRVGRVDFMVGSVIPGRLNVIERQSVVDLAKEIAFGDPSAKRNFMPDIIMRILMTNTAHTHVAIPGTVAGLLCTMSSPSFTPKYLKPLEFAAIGSGQHAVIEIRRVADWLLGGMPGNDLAESMALTDALGQFIAENEIRGVGGTYPCMKVDHRGAAYLGFDRTFPLYKVSLKFDQQKGRWVQENHTTGKKIELLYPWEFLKRRALDDLTFNDLREAIEHANPLRARRVTR